MPEITKLETAAGLTELAAITWDELQRWLKPDCCVMASRVFKDVLAELAPKQRVEPQAVSVYLYNHQAAAHIEAHDCLGVNPECQAAIKAAGGSMAVAGIPRPGSPGPDRWNGHLAVVVDQHILVDLSVSQLNTPERGIPVVGPFINEVPPEWLRQEVGLWGDTPEGVLVAYQVARDCNWKTAPDWIDHWKPFELGPQITQASISRWRGQDVHYDPELYAVRALVGRV